MNARRVAVLGAGLQGVCAALALAGRGHHVTVVDQAADCLLRASLRNEGKIHLGFVYAHDVTCRTSSLMLEAALAFAPLLDRWAGRFDWTRLTRRPFTYLVHRDSMLRPAELFRAWERLDARYEERRKSGQHYLGTRPRRLWTPLAGPPPRIDGALVSAAAATGEHAIDLDAMRSSLRRALHGAPRIATMYGRRIESVARTPAGFRVEGSRRGEASWRLEADVVVNCLWEGRLRIDRDLGLAPRRPWVYRLKYRLMGRLPRALRALPSITMVLGPFGDIVTGGDGRVYLSWYPACLQGWSTDVEAPRAWEDACDGRPDPARADGVRRDALEAFDAIVPGLVACKIDTVDAGVICSWGRSDIADPESELHRRHDVGVHGSDGYYSIDTGKLTCAPLFAERLASGLDGCGA